jgi:hypothetical protein
MANMMATNTGKSEFLNSYNNSSKNSGMTMLFVFPIVIVFLLYLAFLFAEIVYKYMNRLSMNRVELLPNTYPMGSKTVTLTQNPLMLTIKQIQVSDNERTGIEFTYSFYLHVDPSAFTQSYGLLHIFHKGYSKQFPLLAPGVYMHSDKNTLRVYMNTFKTWNNFIDVDNFPLSKWVHVAIVCKDSALEIFINGNLSKKMSFDGHAAYQNYQDVICFNQRRIHVTRATCASIPEEGLDVFGSLKGMMSRLTYFNYALCYAEIQKEMDVGPSSKMDSSNLNDVPPYLADTWWADNSGMKA